MENITNPNSPSVAPVMNFLTTTGMVPFGSHGNGTPPYAYTANGSDPIMQFLGVTDAAQQNGSEQIYLPKSGGGWRPTTNVRAFDPTDADVPSKSPGPPAVIAYGRGFAKPTNGLVMEEAGHSLNKGTVGDGAAQRAFLNLHLLVGFERSPDVSTNVPATLVNGSPSNVSATVSGGTFSPSNPGSYTWASSCPGTFGQATGTLSTAGTVSTTFTPTSGQTTNCNLKFVVTDGCGRVTFGTSAAQAVVPADVSIAKVDSPDPVAAGAQLNYTVTVTNSASSAGAATNVVVKDTLPASLALLSASWQGSPPPGSTCSILSNNLTCTYGDVLAKGASASIAVTAKVLAGAASPIVNTATVSSTNDNNAANNSATASTTVVHPAIALDKTASPAGGVRADFLFAQDDFDTPSPPCTPTSADCGTGWSTTWQEFGESNGWSANDVRVVNPFPAGTTNTVLQVANDVNGVG
jgi:uncharacterized repeat protein (TIGR01451 family)